MTTRKEKIRKLRTLARDKGAFENEAAVAWAKARELEDRMITAKALALAVCRMLEARGLVVRVRPRRTEDRTRSKVDVDVRYFCSRDTRSGQNIRIEITEYP
jgi:Protein of unknown function (DUF2786)